MPVHQFVAILIDRSRYLKLLYHQILFVERSTVGLCIHCLATHYLEFQTGQPLTSCLF